MIFPIEIEKAFDKIHHPLRIKKKKKKPLQKVGIEGTNINIIRPYLANAQQIQFSMVKN